jgi:hypothetical protein
MPRRATELTPAQIEASASGRGEQSCWRSLQVDDASSSAGRRVDIEEVASGKLNPVPTEQVCERKLGETAGPYPEVLLECT